MEGEGWRVVDEGEPKKRRRRRKINERTSRPRETGRWPSRNETRGPRVYAGNVHLARAVRISVLHIRKGEKRGSVLPPFFSLSRSGRLSSTGRRADNSRCGANATAAIDDALLRFLELAQPPGPPRLAAKHARRDAFRLSLRYPVRFTRLSLRLAFDSLGDLLFALFSRAFLGDAILVALGSST